MTKDNVGRYCKSCSDKKQGCHIKCFAYNVALAKYKMDKEKELREKQISNVYEVYICNRPRIKKLKGER